MGARNEHERGVDVSEPVGNSENAVVPRRRGRIENLKNFPKGVSGNPNGRPVIAEGFVEAMRTRAPQAIALIDEALNSDDHWRQQWAVGQILDRAFGKPRQQLDVTVTDVAQVVALLAARKQRMEVK
jgi:hypothetical protein